MSSERLFYIESVGHCLCWAGNNVGMFSECQMECISILNLKSKLGNSLHIVVMMWGWRWWSVGRCDWLLPPLLSRGEDLQVKTSHRSSQWDGRPCCLTSLFTTIRRKDLLRGFCVVRAISIYNFNCRLSAFLPASGTITVLAIILGRWQWELGGLDHFLLVAIIL